MENERAHVVKVFRAGAQRNFLSVTYWFKLMGVVLLAAVSPYILSVVTQAAQKLPPEAVEAFRQGNCYNIGILTVPSLEVGIHTNFNAMALGVLSGGFAQCLAVFAATGFIAGEFSGGYFKLAIMRGEKRPILFTKYIALSVVSSLPLIVLSPVAVMASLAAGGNASSSSPADIAQTLAVQAIMLMALVVCFASIAISLDGRGGSFIGIAAVIALPLIPNYLRIFTNGKVQIKGLFLMSRLADTASGITDSVSGDLLSAAVTAMVFFLLGMIVFLSKNFD
ncbi:MAG: hypothetical protein K2J80_04910 [Oscillospiraceae bacterium]|nr:hypothetical protein [Oscillospiraceae bacterium]